MSVRGSTGSRRLKNQGQTAGHAGEEAESLGSGRGSHQPGTPRPSPFCSHRKTLKLVMPAGKGWEEAAQGAGERNPSRVRMVSTPTAQSPAQRAPTSGTALLASGPLAAGSWTSTSWRLALLTTLGSLTTGNRARVTEVKRGSS